MPARALIALTLILACTPDQPTTPPEKWPDLRSGGAGPSRDPDAAPPMQLQAAEPAAATATAPAHGDDDPLDALAPNKPRAGLPGPRSGSTSGCEGGQRGVGETWKVDCNECSCGDDGQVTCTAMACGYR